jgi:hypothetical protein
MSRLPSTAVAVVAFDAGAGAGWYYCGLLFAGMLALVLLMLPFVITRQQFSVELRIRAVSELLAHDGNMPATVRALEQHCDATGGAKPRNMFQFITNALRMLKDKGSLLAAAAGGKKAYLDYQGALAIVAEVYVGYWEQVGGRSVGNNVAALPCWHTHALV